MIPEPEEVDQLRDTWKSLQPLKPEDDTRLWKKLRLEWNYHSNHIEGNTLTYGETELLLLHGQTFGHHSHREHVEMKAHDAAIQHVHELAADPRLLTEADIRDLNQIILKEPYWKEAQTPDGQPTRKQIIPGQYKTTPNNVRLADGSIFDFASVEDTPPRMQALSARLQKELTTPSLHPVVFAALLHHEFVLIHPFDDGNGRVARLLVNYVLMRNGFLPIVIRTDDKAAYLNYLRLADAGDPEPLTDYMLGLAKQSLEMGIKAAKGEPIEEPTDLEKEIAIFIRNQKDQGKTDEAVKPLSIEVLRDLYERGWNGLFETVARKLGKLDSLFADHFLMAGLIPQQTTDLRKSFEESITELGKPPPSFNVRHHLKGFNGVAPEPYTIVAHLSIIFDEFRYQVKCQHRQVLLKRYSEPVLPDEADKIANQMLASVFAEIKQRSGVKD